MPDLDDPLAALAAPPIFIVGMHRSGTTWAYEMVASHPNVCGVFESGLFSADLGVAPLFHPVHWYGGEVRERDKRFFGAQFRLSQLLGRHKALADIRELAACWLARALEPEHRYLVEKTPQHVHTMPLIAELFPGAAFVHVIRDGRDVAVSAEQAARDWPRGRVRATELTGVADRWAGAIRAARQAATEHDLRYAEVRFEDLKQHPERELGRVLEFCGIESDSTQVAALVASNAIEVRRQAGGRDAFRRRGEIGGWHEAMGLRDRLRFDRAAGDLLVELGYAPSRRWWFPGATKIATAPRITKTGSSGAL